MDELLILPTKPFWASDFAQGRAVTSQGLHSLMVHPQKAAGPPQWRAPGRIRGNSGTRQWNSDWEWPRCSISVWILHSHRQENRHHQTTALPWVRKSVGIGELSGWKRLQPIRELGELPGHTLHPSPRVHTSDSHGTGQEESQPPSIPSPASSFLPPNPPEAFGRTFNQCLGPFLSWVLHSQNETLHKQEMQ